MNVGSVFLLLLFQLNLIGLSTSEGANTSVTVQDNSLAVNLVAKGINNAREFILIGNDVLLINDNSYKVNLIKDGILRKYAVVNVNPGQSNESGLVGISSNQIPSGFTVLLGYIDSTDGQETLSNKIIYAYEWNQTAFELTNPRRVIQFPVGNSNNNFTGTVTTDKNYLAYLVEDSLPVKPSISNTKDQTKGSNCNSRILVASFGSSSSLQNSSDQLESYELGDCYEGQLHSLVYEDRTHNLWTIESLLDGNQRILEINLDTGKNRSYDICRGNLIDHYANGQRIPNECTNEENQNNELASLALADSDSIGEAYLNQLFVAYSNGSIYNLFLDSNTTVGKSTENLMNLFASGLGHISQIHSSNKGLYVLASRETFSGEFNETETSLFLISRNNENNLTADLTSSVSNGALVSTALIVTGILLILLLINKRKAIKGRISE